MFRRVSVSYGQKPRGQSVFRSRYAPLIRDYKRGIAIPVTILRSAHKTASRLREQFCKDSSGAPGISCRSSRTLKAVAVGFPSRKYNLSMPPRRNGPVKSVNKRTKTPGSLSISIPKRASSILSLAMTIIPIGGAFLMYPYNSGPLMWYSSWSILSILAYGFDKYKATNQLWRTRENSLHLIDFIGGWPGGYVAQRFFHHKTSKRSFQRMFWAIVLLHNVLWFWLSRDAIPGS